MYFFLSLFVSYREIVFDLITYPLTIYPKERFLPIFGPYDNFLTAFLFYIPFLVYILVFIIAIRRSWKVQDRKQKVFLWEVTLFYILGLAFLLKGLSRIDVGHLLPYAVTALILGSILVNQLEKFSKKRFFVEFYVLWFFVTLAAVLLPYWLLTVNQFFQQECLPILRRAPCISVSSDQIQAIKFVQNKTRGDEKIFVGNIRHDKMVANDVMFYFLADRQSATKYYELSPGFSNTVWVQNQIVDELKNNSVNYVVLFSGFDRWVESNNSSVSSGVFLLDNFIKENYETIQVYGSYTILHKR